MVFESSNKKSDYKVKRADKSQNPLTKVVVRKLPPSFTEEDFKNAIDPVPDYNYFRFAISDKSLGPHAYSRAYISFTNPDEILVFKEKFDGYVFVDQKGNEYPAIVEYAPFQKIPKISPHQKKDLRCSTIDEDSDYLSFLESLNNPEAVVLPQIENILEEIENQEKELKANNGVPKIKTPLLEYVEQRANDRLRPGDKRRRKEYDRKRPREEDKRRRKDIKEFRKKDDRGSSMGNMSNSPSTYRERQRRREEERQRMIEIREKEKKNRRAKESEKETPDRNSDMPESYAGEAQTPSFKSKRYSEARKKDEREKKNRELSKTQKYSRDEVETKVDETAEYITEDANAEETHEAHSNQEEDAEKEFKNAASNNERETSLDKEIDSDSNNPKMEEIDIDSYPANEEKEDSNHYRDGSSDSQPNFRRDGKDPRMERRIRNKDRPDMQLYRPGQSRLSIRTKQQEDESQERHQGDSSSSSPSPVQGKEEKKDTQKDCKEETPSKEREKPYKDKWTKDRDSYKSHYEKRGHRYKGGYYWEGEWEKDGYGKYREDSDGYGYEEGSSRGSHSHRKGYSYFHERENKGKRSTKTKEQESSQMKSITFRRSTSQE